MTTSPAAPKIWPTREARRPVADFIIVSISRSGIGSGCRVRSSSVRTSSERTWRSSIGATKGATSADVFGKASVAPPDVDLLAALALSATTTPNMLRAQQPECLVWTPIFADAAIGKRLSSLPPLN